MDKLTAIDDREWSVLLRDNRQINAGIQIGDGGAVMIRKLKTGEYRIYSRHADPRTGKRKNLGTFATREKAEEHERAIQYFKRH
jgi:hypothetical protein